MKITKKCILATVAATLALAMSLTACGGKSGEYPTKGIEVICPWSAGGGTDACLRAFTDAMGKDLGQTLTVNNITGGGGITGHQAIAGVERILTGKEHTASSNEKITSVLPDLKTIKQIWPNILSGSIIGTFIGAIPGAGGDIAVFVSYGASKSVSKHPELYDTGIPQGVAATESANNGCSGGAMIPLLSLGIPGDAVTAVLLGAFIMKGIQPGPMMYVSELHTVYKVFAALMLANLCMLIVGCLGVRFFAKIVSVEKTMLYPIILVISLLGAFSINKSVFNIGVCVAFGIFGWLMNKYEFPLSPILLTLILGPMCEKNFVRFMNIHHGRVFDIFQSPIAMVFLTVAIGTIIFSIFNQRKINQREAEARSNSQKQD